VGEVIGEILPAAVGVAISPLPIVAVILMLLSGKAGANSLSFFAGWVLGLSAVGALVLAFGGAVSDDDQPAAWTGWAKILFGVLFLLMAWNAWRTRPTADHDPEMPNWIKAIDKVTPLLALGLGVLLSALNPKNLALTLAAAAAIAAAGLSTGQEIGALIAFVVIAISTVAVPVIIYYGFRSRAEGILGGMQEWLIENNATITLVLSLILAAVLFRDGIAILSV
jgi:threonine/homoserine/homoserine lactone efflux protein